MRNLFAANLSDEQVADACLGYVLADERFFHSPILYSTCLPRHFGR